MAFSQTMNYCKFLNLCAALIFLYACSSGNRTKENNQSVCNAEGNEVREIPLFSKHGNYESNLSAIASNIKFISLGMEPVLNESGIGDVQLSDEYIFLTDIHHIRQYDKEGEFIREIGQRGMGREDYINVFPPIQIDYRDNLIYVVDSYRSRMLRYGFDGNFVDVFPIDREANCIALIDEHMIAVRQTMSERRFDNPCRLISFLNTEGEAVKSYQSNLYPIDCVKESFGPEVSLLWEYKNNFYYLEYGADTIFCINNSLLIPTYKLTGNLKVEGEEIFLMNNGRKLRNVQYAFRPYSSVFESDYFMIFRITSDYERFFAVYNKNTGEFHRTFYENPEIVSVRKQGDIKIMDYFIDDMVSGLRFNPQYQSYGKAVALIPAVEIAENREDILRFIAAHPSDESARLKAMVERMDEFDNPLMMTVMFK
jgi:hypothetical protein